MDKERKEHSFIKKPIFPGGRAAMKRFIAKHLRYPKEALENKIEGFVAIRFSINHKGKVGGIKIISGLGYGCDEEAKRLVSLLKWDINKKIRKGKILFHKTLNIHFKLPKAQENKKQSTQISYQIVGSSPTSAPKKKTSYQYTIKY